MSAPEIWFQTGEALVAANHYGTPEFNQGLELLKQAAAAEFLEAQVTLGNVYAQVHLLPDAALEAAYWYKRAAAQGHPMAQDRLADLHMIGRGVPQNDMDAFDWYARTAAQAYAMAQCNLAYMHAEGIGTPQDDVAATSLYLRAAAQGEPRAYFNLGLRYQPGLGAPGNPMQAGAWMVNAARFDYPGSKIELAAIEANLSTAERSQARELAACITQNFTDLQQKLGKTPDVASSAETYQRVVEENFAELGMQAFALDSSRRFTGTVHAGGITHGGHIPAAAKHESERPPIFTVDSFVSKSECSHLMALASYSFKPAAEHTRDRLSGEQTSFTGHATTFHPASCDAVIRNLERRIAAAFNLSRNHVEPVSVLRYQGGDTYAPHVDYFDAARLAENRRIGDFSGQRIASFLVYLRAPAAGGETHYVKIGRKITGRERMALCHYNLLPDGNPDAMTLHTGEPVLKGEKWLARTTLREKPFY